LIVCDEVESTRPRHWRAGKVRWQFSPLYFKASSSENGADLRHQWCALRSEFGVKQSDSEKRCQIRDAQAHKFLLEIPARRCAKGDFWSTSLADTDRMPITPFHFGPGAAVHALAPQHVSFLAFCTTNVLIDFESLYNLINRHDQVHAFFHTYIGATSVVAATIALFFFLKWFSRKFWLPNILGWQALSARQVAIGAALGGYSHVALDSIMHLDIRPLSPMSNSNALLSLVSLSTLHWVCVALGMVGMLGVGIRKAFASEKEAT
jgi:hypothetical protein